MGSQPSPLTDSKVRGLFEQALHLPSSARGAFVRQQSGGDQGVAGQVLNLLESAEERVRQNFGMTLEEGSDLHGTATFELLQKLAVAAPLDTVRYRVESQIGRGGMGAVMGVRDAYLNRQLAMKVMLELGTPRDDVERRIGHQLLGRFLEEAQVTSQLDHPGVVPVHELGIDDSGRVFFTMRLVKGDTLREVFEKAASEEDGWNRSRALEAMLKVCDTVAYAHSKGVLHRDLKPANVMVGRFGEVYVMDWGLAKVLGQEDRHDLRIREEEPIDQAEITVSSRTLLQTARREDADTMDGASVMSMDGQQLGTPTYMAPEQARSEPLDERADVYSLGAMLYTLLAGRPPYVVPGMQMHAYRILEKVVAGPPERLESIVSEVPAELVAVVDRAMARNKLGRYPTVKDLATDLRAYLDGKVVQAYETGALAEMRMWIRRNKPLASSLASAVLLLVAGVVVSVWFGTEANAERIVAVSATQAAQQSAAEATRQRNFAEEQSTLAVAAKDRAEQAESAVTEKAKQLEEQAGQLKTQVDRFEQVKGVVDFDRLMDRADEVFVPRSQRAATMTAWLREAQAVRAKRKDFEQKCVDLRRDAPPSSPTADVEAAVGNQRKQCDQLVEHLTWLNEIEAVRAGAQRLRDPKLPDQLKRLGREPEEKWLGRLLSVAGEHTGALEGNALLGELEENALLGEWLAPGVRAANALAASGEALAFIKKRKQWEWIEPLVRRHLAWALAAHGREQDALEQLALASKAAEAWRASARDDKERESLDSWARAVENATRVMPTKIELAWVSRGNVEAKLSETRAALAELERQRVKFDENAKLSEFLHGEVSRFLAGLDALDAKRAEIERELAWAKKAQDLAQRPPEWPSWDQCRQEIAVNPAYKGKAIAFGKTLMEDVVPLGVNPKTQLWEFYDLRSAWDGSATIAQVPMPKRGADGNFEVTGKTGIVLVLLPGGIWQLDGTTQATVAPFLISRYETTQGQWSRLWRGGHELRRPAARAAGSFDNWFDPDKGGEREFITSSHPVESVDWNSCRAMLRANGMQLPSEAQWEYACRAGGRSPDYVAAKETCNIADETYGKAPTETAGRAPWDDGYRVHAPVGSYGANAFGLHDMLGNVKEWCEEGEDRMRFCRGASFESPLAKCAPSVGFKTESYRRNDTIGVRAVRSLDD